MQNKGIFCPHDYEWNKINEAIDSKIESRYFVETRPVSIFGSSNQLELLIHFSIIRIHSSISYMPIITTSVFHI